MCSCMYCGSTFLPLGPLFAKLCCAKALLQNEKYITTFAKNICIAVNLVFSMTRPVLYAQFELFV